MVAEVTKSKGWEKERTSIVPDSVRPHWLWTKNWNLDNLAFSLGMFDSDQTQPRQVTGNLR